jgi:hypothetical protein
VKAKATLAWDPSPDAFVVSGGGYRAFWKLSSSEVWTQLHDTADLSIDVLDIAPGTYDFKVQAINWAGNPSVALALTQPIAGLSAPPAAPSGLTVVASGGLAIARWALPADLDVLQGGSIAFRHSSVLSGATWDQAVSIADPMAGNLSAAVLPLKAGTYLAKFIDASGNYSAAAASFSQAQASVLSFASSFGSSVQDPAFAGTTTNMVSDNGTLKLGGAGTDFDSVPDVDALSSWDYSPGAGGVAATGSYAFDRKLDLGTVKACRLTSTLESRVVNIFDTIDERASDVDSWADWDGAVSGNEADAVLMVRSTADDPNGGSPAWSGWQRLDTADFNARGFEFRLDAASGDASFNIFITALDVVAEGL